MTTTSFAVTGMTCGNCERHVRQAAEKVTGVASVVVDRPGNRATVSFDPAQTSPRGHRRCDHRRGIRHRRPSGGASGSW